MSELPDGDPNCPMGPKPRVEGSCAHDGPYEKGIVICPFCGVAYHDPEISAYEDFDNDSNLTGSAEYYELLCRRCGINHGGPSMPAPLPKKRVFTMGDW